MNDDIRGDEIIDVKMPRKDFKTIQKMVEERQAYDTITSKLKSYWIWAVVGGVLTVFTLWDAIKIRIG